MLLLDFEIIFIDVSNISDVIIFCNYGRKIVTKFLNFTVSKVEMYSCLHN